MASELCRFIMNKNFFENRPHFIPCVIAATVLLGALGRWPYGYYQLLRWITCGAAVFVAICSYGWQKIWLVWLFGFVAVLFNPLVPIHLSREVWQPIDVICSMLFISWGTLLKEPGDKA